MSIQPSQTPTKRPKVEIRLGYEHEGNTYDFRLDLTSSTDRDRLIKTIEWGARNHVPIYISTDKIIADSKRSAA